MTDTPLEATLSDQDKKVDLQLPQKQSVVLTGGIEGLAIGGISAGFGSQANVALQERKAIRQFIKAAETNPEFAGVAKKEIRKAARTAVKEIAEFSHGSHNKWTTIALATGTGIGATVGVMQALAHNKKVENFTDQLEADRANQAINAAQGPVKG